MTQTFELGILFADVVGSTRLYETLGDRDALLAIESCVRVMSGVIRSHGGRVVKTIGDEVMAAIPTAPATCDAAVTIQRTIDALVAVAGGNGTAKLALHVGFHFGRVLEENGDFFGDTVNLAARMLGMANAGQILTTSETWQLLSPNQQNATRNLGGLRVKGKAQEVSVVEVIWQESVDMTRAFAPRAPAPGKRLALTHSQREWTFDDRHASVALGRDASNDIVVADNQASRKHATIERRRDKWVLIDHSMNGTFVTIEGEGEIGLRREELILRGSGIVSFGHPAEDSPERVHFEVG